MWCPLLWLAKAEGEGKTALGQSPEQPSQGWWGTMRHQGLRIRAQKLPRQCCRCSATAWQLACLSKGDPLLPRDAFAHCVAFSWQGSPQAPKGAEEPTHFPLSPRARQEAPNPWHNQVLQQKALPKTCTARAFPEAWRYPPAAIQRYISQ